MLKSIYSKIRGYNTLFDTEINTIKEDDFKVIKKSGKRTSSIFKKDVESLIYLSYKTVKIELIALLRDGKFTEVIKTIYKEKGLNLSDKQINRYNHNHLLSFTLWVLDELENIAKLERQYLSSEAEIELISAGINEMDQFGHINIIDAIAGGDVLKWEDILKLPYYKIFDKQHKNLIENKIQKKLSKIRQKKQNGYS